MRRISSKMTWWNKKAVPTLWFGFLAVFTCFWIPAVLQGQVPAFTLLGPIGMAVFAYLLMRALVFCLVDEVWLDGDDVIVRNRGEEDRFPIANIANVDCAFLTNPERITLTLRTPTHFGREIAFSPPQRLFPFGRHPIARELVARIHGLDVSEPMRSY